MGQSFGNIPNYSDKLSDAILYYTAPIRYTVYTVVQAAVVVAAVVAVVSQCVVVAVAVAVACARLVSLRF